VGPVFASVALADEATPCAARLRRVLRQHAAARAGSCLDSIEAVAKDRWRFADIFTVVFGAQLVDTSRDVRVIEASDGARRNPKGDYSSVNPRVGVIYAFGAANEVFANASRLFEAPTTFELEDDARGTNELLDPMQGSVFEVGVRGAAETRAGTQWRWDVAAYYAKIDDEILSVEDPDEPRTSLSKNVDATVHAGIEALLGASFALAGEAHRLEPLVSLTLNDFHFDSDSVYGDNDLPAAPKYAARGEVVYHHASGFYAGPTFDFIGKRHADFANSYSVDAYEVFGLRAGYATKSWELFAEVRNVTDEDYIATVSVRDRAAQDAEILFPGARTSAYVGVRVAF